MGHVIKAGQTLFRIDGEPVILMDGSAPAYRELSASDTPGADIEQLNRNLERLGFDPGGIVVDDEWQPATTVGVELLRESLGELETGSLPLGQVVFLPGPRVITALDGTVGSTGGGGGSAGGGGSSQSTSASPGAAAPEFVSLEHATSGHDLTPAGAKGLTASSACRGNGGGATGATSTTASSNTTAVTTTAATTPGTTSCQTSTPPSASAKPAPSAPASGGELSKLTALLKAEAAQLRAATAVLRAAKRSPSSDSSGGRSGSSPSAAKSSGDGGAPATAILETSSTQLIVSVDLSASSQGEAKVGAHVSVQLPSGKTVAGMITAVSPVAQAASGSGGGSGGGGAGGGSGSGGSGASSTVPVTIKLKGHRRRDAGLDQASVSVSFVQAQAKHVLSVPVTALIATSGGGYAVQEAAAPGKLLAVTTGLFAAGDVEISGRSIHPGLVVTTSQG